MCHVVRTCTHQNSNYLEYVCKVLFNMDVKWRNADNLKTVMSWYAEHDVADHDVGYYCRKQTNAIYDDWFLKLSHEITCHPCRNDACGYFWNGKHDCP